MPPKSQAGKKVTVHIGDPAAPKPLPPTRVFKPSSTRTSPCAAPSTTLGYITIPYRLTAEDMPRFPRVPDELVAGRDKVLEEAGWDREEHEEP